MIIDRVIKIFLSEGAVAAQDFIDSLDDDGKELLAMELELMMIFTPNGEPTRESRYLWN